MWQVREMWQVDEDRASRSRSTAHGCGARRALASVGRSVAMTVVTQRSRSVDPLDSQVPSPWVPLPCDLSQFVWLRCELSHFVLLHFVRLHFVPLPCVPSRCVR